MQKKSNHFRLINYGRCGPQLKKQFWIEHIFWSDGYFVCSTGDASTETINKYIESRG